MMATPARPAPPPPPIRKGQVVAVEAVHSYKATTDAELSFEAGDLLFVLDQSNSDWWRARRDQKEGLVPSNYVSKNNMRVPLIDGARRGNEELVRECLTAGVSVNALDRAGSSALHAASQGGHLACVALLATAGSSLDLQNKLGDTALHCAASKGHDDVTRLLLSNGAHQNLCNKDGKTARMLARRASVLGEFDAEELRRRGPSTDLAADDEYGNTEDSD